MEKLKWLAVILIFLMAFMDTSSGAYAQEYLTEQFRNIPNPSQTELIYKKTETTKNIEGTYYKYLSELSQNEIVQFYRNIFVSEEGLKEEGLKDTGNKVTLNFLYGDGAIKRVVLAVFKSYPKNYGPDLGGKVSYYLSVFENNDLLGLSIFKPAKPKSLDFAPVYQGAEQFCFYDQPSRWKVATYLVNGGIGDVAAFYRRGMQGFKWELVSEQSYEGQFNLFDALVLGDTNSKEKIKGEEKWPGIDLNIKKVVLTFKQENRQEECVIHIIQFNDSPETLKEKHINPGPFEKYGNIFINLIMYNKNK